jgi:pyrimidine nucleoside transport protein
MGVHQADCRVVGELIGIKTFINEFVAYEALSVYIDNEKNFTWYKGLAENGIHEDTERVIKNRRRRMTRQFTNILKG